MLRIKIANYLNLSQNKNSTLIRYNNYQFLSPLPNIQIPSKFSLALYLYMYYNKTYFITKPVSKCWHNWWIGGRSGRHALHALAGLAATLGIITLIMNKGDPQRIWGTE
jgi:hypothetical protein